MGIELFIHSGWGENKVVSLVYHCFQEDRDILSGVGQTHEWASLDHLCVVDHGEGEHVAEYG